MRVLVACEESQAVCIAFRERGHEAYSCDIQPCSGGHPEWHIQADARELLKVRWDLIVAHPPCTYLTNGGANNLMTNGDKIRSMTDEEMLEYITNACPPVKCEDDIMCDDCWLR